MKSNIILIGAGGHAHNCIDLIEREGRFNIAGLVGTQKQLNEDCLGYKVIATDIELPQLATHFQYALVAVGQIESVLIRRRLYDLAIDLGFKIPTIISPSAYVSSHALLAKGSIVMHGAIINSGARIGRNCIINSRALIEHGAVIGDHCHISTGAILNGNATLGQGSFIGSGSIIKQGIALGDNCLVGMGLAIRHNYPENSKILSNQKI